MTIIAYHPNPLMCSLYSEYLLTVCDAAYACVLISDPIHLNQYKDQIRKDLVACCIFDMASWPIVDVEMEGKTPILLIDRPESRETITRALREADLECRLCRTLEV